MLRMAADEFSSHGCNDFDLVKDGDLTVRQATDFAERMYRHCSGGYDGADGRTIVEDWMVMTYLDDLLRSEAGGDDG